MSFLVATVLLAVVTAVACALPGAFVVLRKNSMLVDAISHAVLPGIVLGYFFTRDLDSPLLVFGAALAGLVVVLGSEWLSRTGLLTGDAPQGLIFPALFSVGVILVTLNFADVHLDTHAVLVGDLNLAAFVPIVVGGVSIGPAYLYLMLGVLALNIAFLAAFSARLTLTTFDAAFARTIGIRTGLLNGAFMLLVSVTVTASFNGAGAILVVALMIVPPATAYLISRRLSVMITLTVVIAVFGALAGFWLAYVLDAATSAGMAVFYGLIFIAVFGLSRLTRRGSRARALAAMQARPVARPAAQEAGVTHTASVAARPSGNGEPPSTATLSTSE
ncbi:metal ABC transporter permease [Microbacterium aquimaris]|uniref:Metal ABC transporter permease n=1 Tax=Microbacterium aquimaris TaxID=459816 RepID=A0ABU5N3S9_9MICO|nr:metal ABC transporter permease [Microbacterium aquimaris]MDZ8160757.1 metal ABC transporter permease [Microbacterium aquimaris]